MDDCEINGVVDVQNDEIYDYESFETFRDAMFTIFDTYAEPYHNEKCLDLIQLNKMVNPDVVPHAQRLDWLINDLQFESAIGMNKLTMEDLERLIN